MGVSRHGPVGPLVPTRRVREWAGRRDRQGAGQQRSSPLFQSCGTMNLNSSAGLELLVWSQVVSGLQSRWSLRGPDQSLKSSSASFTQMMPVLLVSWK
jgi:hypothetical protein